ncbi:G-protein coupled receptor Mth2-like isoform X2 [Onthophagus taurus]|uniref:G-protein coupled receptor Mth2-like isoform X2 n=1 Tax=Onthophagus taurus TaxID=166361 RepID=UPI0039BE8A66
MFFILRSGAAKMICTSVIILVVFISSAKSFPKCCEEDNYVLNGSCIDGSKLNIEDSKCKFTFTLSNDEYIVTENNSLLLLSFDDLLYHSDHYCITKKYGTITDIAVVCETDLLSNEEHHILRPVCGLISVLFMLLTILVYITLPQLRDLQGKCILHTLAGLATAFLSLAILQISPIANNSTCIFMAFLTYASFLLAFFWLNVVAFNVWKNIVKPNMLNKNDDFWHMIYCVYAYGMTLVFVITTLSAHHVEGDHIRPRFGEGSCFFNGETATWAYFYGPITILLIINFILFMYSCAVLWGGKQQLSTQNIRGAKYRCLMTMKLFLIMGLLWIFEVISYATQDKHEILNKLWAVTDYINTIQGILIFLLLVVFRKRALRGLASKYSCFGKFTRSWQTLDDEECVEEEEDSKGLNVTI